MTWALRTSLRAIRRLAYRPLSKGSWRRRVWRSVSSNRGTTLERLIISQRRRNQNRLAQQAFRERKDRNHRELEKAVDEWQVKYQSLLKSYDEQGKELADCKATVEVLDNQVSSFQRFAFVALAWFCQVKTNPTS